MSDVVGLTTAEALRVLQLDRDQTALVERGSGARLEVAAAAVLVVVGTRPAAGEEVPDGTLVTLEVAPRNSG